MKQSHATVYTSLVGVAETYATSFPLALEALVHLLEGRRDRGSHVSTLAILKRMTSLSLHLPTEGAVALLSLLSRALVSDGVRYQGMLENSQGGMGVYLPECEDPELCHAAAASLWELSLLSLHYNPYVGSVARAFADARGRESLPTDPPFIYLRKYDTTKGDLVPPPLPPPLHPLQKIIMKERRKEGEEKGKKKRQERPHFIRPQTTYSERDAGDLEKIDRGIGELETAAEREMGEFFESNFEWEKEREERKMKTLLQLRQIMEEYERYRERKEESAAMKSSQIQGNEREERDREFVRVRET